MTRVVGTGLTRLVDSVDAFGPIVTLTGDVTASGQSPTLATLATVNSTPGSFGSLASLTVPKITVDAKGRVTSATQYSLGSSAGYSVGTSGSAIPLLNTVNTWSATQTFGDIYASRGASSGAVYFGSSGSNYIYLNAGSYNFAGGGITAIAGASSLAAVSATSLTLTANITAVSATFSGTLTASKITVGSGSYPMRIFSDGDNGNYGIGNGNYASITTGQNNFALGYNALNSLTTGGGNSVLGNYAGTRLTTGTSNTFVGQASGQQIATGSGNTLVGVSSGLSLTGSDSTNTIVGAYAGVAGMNSNVILADGNGVIRFRWNQASSNLAVGSAINPAVTGNLNVIVGAGGLSSLTTGFLNTLMGSNAGSLLTTGAANVASGSNALGNITTGTGNAAFGSGAGASLTGSDSYNTIMGAYTGVAGSSNNVILADGNGNVRFRWDNARSNVGAGITLSAITTGSDNAAFGDRAGNQITTGQQNSVFGVVAGNLLTTGSNNSFYGLYAGSGVTTGGSNTIVGNFQGTAGLTNSVVLADGDGNVRFRWNPALSSVRAGTDNAATGLYNNTYGSSAGNQITIGGGNNLFGQASGQAITTGSYNVCYGQSTGQAITTGGNNTLIGQGAGSNLSGADSSNTLVGNWYGTGGLSNNVVLSDGGGNVRFRWDQANNGIYIGNTGVPTSGSYNTLIGSSAAPAITTGQQNLVVGLQAGGRLTTGSNNTLLGTNAGSGLVGGYGNTIIGSYPAPAGANNIVALADGSGTARFLWDGSFNTITGSTTVTNGAGSFSFAAGASSATPMTAIVSSNRAVGMFAGVNYNGVSYDDAGYLAFCAEPRASFTGGTLSGAGEAARFDSSGNFGIGTIAPLAKLHIASTVQASAHIILSGQEFYQSGNTDRNGMAFLLGVNRPGNRQLWIAPSDGLAVNTTNPTLSMILTSGTVAITARATDGQTALPLVIQNGGGATTIGGSLTAATATINNGFTAYGTINLSGPVSAQSLSTTNGLQAGNGFTAYGAITLSGPTTVVGLFATNADALLKGSYVTRIENNGTGAVPGSSGVGLELYRYGGVSQIQSFDRTANASAPLQFNASTFTIYGSTTINSSLSVTGPVTAPNILPNADYVVNLSASVSSGATYNIVGNTIVKTSSAAAWDVAGYVGNSSMGAASLSVRLPPVGGLWSVGLSSGVSSNLGSDLISLRSSGSNGLSIYLGNSQVFIFPPGSYDGNSRAQFIYTGRRYLVILGGAQVASFTAPPNLSITGSIYLYSQGYALTELLLTAAQRDSEVGLNTFDATGTLIGSKSGALQAATATIGAGVYPVVISTDSGSLANMGVGAQAGNTTAATGTNNIAVGYQTLANLTSGGNNTAVGLRAGISSTTASQSVFIGTNSGYSVTSGVSNTMLGFQAGNNITTGGANTLVGSQAGSALTGADNSNTIVGPYVGTAGMVGNIILADGGGGVKYRWNGSIHTFTGPVTATVNYDNSLFNGKTSSVYGVQGAVDVANYMTDLNGPGVAIGVRANVSTTQTDGTTANSTPNGTAGGTIAGLFNNNSPNIGAYARGVSAYSKVGSPLYVSNNTGVVLETLQAGTTVATILRTIKYATAYPGTTTGNFHLSGGSNGTTSMALTFAGSGGSGNSTVAQAGIYVQSDDTLGTSMMLATTNSYAAGPTVAINIDNLGNVTLPRGNLQLSVANSGSAVAAPTNINLGGNYSSTAGLPSGLKLKLYDGAAANAQMGFGISSNQMDYVIGSGIGGGGAVYHAFWINGIATLKVSSAVITSTFSNSANAAYRVYNNTSLDGNSNPNGQTALDFQFNGTRLSRIRADYLGNLNYAAGPTGQHNFYVSGDTLDGRNVFPVAIGNNYMTPGGDNSTILGTSNLRWAAVNTVNLTAGGTITGAAPYRNSNSATALALSDTGGTLGLGNNGGTVTIPANATVPFVAGTRIKIMQWCTGSINIMRAPGVAMRWYNGSGSAPVDADRTLAIGGWLDLIYIGGDNWVITGAQGLT